ncbi:gallidermin/nisin family lantibiotic [Romboutsia sedimentorum]|uniref:Gallidermin/nisin family lantibiotic n=1 Tax=Romboutsia sedimentorum TaxID=1368474 RepID=A0ABT7EBB1_9FIRM|nr:gallidermin/nisin family lantibiotic [Romboutsia sedimentorum]MDK2564225.1 gallidermin/nisin family lantibiotic [Romboutsia sedimentorum]
MGKTNDFDLDLKVKEGTKKGVQPAITSVILCSLGCN